MKLVVFGLTISSSWANGHATLWRGLCRGLASLGHDVTFFERDVPYYAHARDAERPDDCDLRLYSDWAEVLSHAEAALEDADVGVVTSYCPDGPSACDLVLNSRVQSKVFYDLDTPVTLSRLRGGEPVTYLPTYGLGHFDLVLSYTGGRALDQLRTQLGARAVAPLYGSVDPDVHRPAPITPRFACDLSYLGTYALDRQDALDRLFLQAADHRPASRFVLAGSQYPEEFAWKPNVYYVWHLTPADHPSLYCSSALTLNVTRGPMAEMGFCPSGRLFEAAACGATIVTDDWEGLDQFFQPAEEILVATTTGDTLAALDLGPGDRRAIGDRARERTLDCHTAAVRARDLERILNTKAVDPTTACDRNEDEKAERGDSARTPTRSDHVGHRSGSGAGEPNSTAGVFERAVAGRQPQRW